MWFGETRRPVVVDVDGEELAHAVARLLSPLLLEGPAAGQGVDGGADLVIARRGADIIVRDERNAGPPPRFRNVSKALGVIEHHLVTLLLRRQRDKTLLHAAGWSATGGIALVVGPSGAGKSSLALEASLRGLPILADDCILARADGCVRGVPRLLKVHRRQLRLHGLSPNDTVAPHPGEVEHWWDPARSGGWFRAWGTPGIVARATLEPDLRRATTTVLRPEGGLRLLLDGVMDGGLPPSASIDRLLVLARSALCVDLRFGAVDDGLDALLALLDRAGT